MGTWTKAGGPVIPDSDMNRLGGKKQLFFFLPSLDADLVIVWKMLASFDVVILQSCS